MQLKQARAQVCFCVCACACVCRVIRAQTVHSSTHLGDCSKGAAPVRRDCKNDDVSTVCVSTQITATKPLVEAINGKFGRGKDSMSEAEWQQLESELESASEG